MWAGWEPRQALDHSCPGNGGDGGAGAGAGRGASETVPGSQMPSRAAGPGPRGGAQVCGAESVSLTRV